MLTHGATSDDGPMSTMFRREVFDLLGPFAKVRSRGDVEYRERIRQSLGPQSFDETTFPLVFCFGAPTTLSLKINQEKADALKTFRHSFGQRGWSFSRDDIPPNPLGEIAVPRPLAP